MRYTFNQGTDGNLNDAGNWTPGGGPPGTNDLAGFTLVIGNSETLTGSASVEGAEFTTHGGLGDGGSDSTFDLDNVTFSTTAMLVDAATVFESGGSMVTDTLQVSDGRFMVENGATLETGRVVLKPAADYQVSELGVIGGTWTDTGNVIVNASPNSHASAGITVVQGTAAIDGNFSAAAGPNEVDLVTWGGLLTVAGNVNILARANIVASDQGGLAGVIHVGGSIFVNPPDSVAAAGIAAVGAYNSNNQFIQATIDVGHNLVLGNGILNAEGGVISAGDKLALLDGSSAYLLNGTIEAPTVTLSGMAFLTATEEGIPGPNTITGVGGGAATVFNAGTIDVQSALIVSGDVRGHGTLMVGERDPGRTTVGDMTVNGTLAGQDIQFGAADSTLFADHFGANAVQYFAAGDIIASPGIQSIAWDPTSHTLSMDKGGGTVESLHMAGEFGGQQFTLSQNEYITLQPAPSQA